MEHLLKSAIQAVLRAGDEILKVYETDFGVETKSDNSPLTIADKKAHDKIVEILKDHNLPVLSEEGADIPHAERAGWKRFWMVDPLDGTKEFVKRNGEFTVNIALIENQQSVLGVIYVPVTKVLYFGSKELGSYKLLVDAIPDELEGIIAQAKKLPVELKRKFTVVASRSHLSEETVMFIDGLKTTHKELEFISSGSSIKLCLVAEGAADVYPRFAPTMEWDTAAGQAICEAAGKRVVDYKTNSAMLYNKENLLNSWFIVS